MCAILASDRLFGPLRFPFGPFARLHAEQCEFHVCGSAGLCDHPNEERNDASTAYEMVASFRERPAQKMPGAISLAEVGADPLVSSRAYTLPICATGVATGHSPVRMFSWQATCISPKR